MWVKLLGTFGPASLSCFIGTHSRVNIGRLPYPQVALVTETRVTVTSTRVTTFPVRLGV